MKYNPHEYQKYATDWIIEKEKCGVFIDMGLGKTVATLTAIDELMYDRFEIQRVLVIAPLRVAQNVWDAEIEKWDHLNHFSISKILGPEKRRMKALNTEADIYVINRENVEWLVNLYKNYWPFDMVVVDEMSSFKSNKSKRFRALRKMRPFIKRMVGLTGTPAPNGLIDLWPQIYLLDGGERLGKTITGYRERYFVPDKRSRDVIFTYKPRPGSEEAIYEKISDICISMKAEDYLQLPGRVNNTIKVEMPEKAKKKYDQLERDKLLPLLESDVEADSAGVLTNKLLQMAGGAVYDEHGSVEEIHKAKLNALEEVIEAAGGKPVMVFYSYRHEMDRILNKFKARVLDKKEDIEDWNRGEVPVMLAHPASTGHGLNLQTGGNIIIWFGLPWSLELYQQANARLDRQGQEETVVIHHLVTQGTVDEDVMRVLENKESGQDALLEAVKARVMNTYAISGEEVEKFLV